MEVKLEEDMVSIKMIAEKCNVSAATVSKALNDQKDISEETKARIKKVAGELGYMPNAAARALKTKRSQNVGVLFEEQTGRGLAHEYFSGVLNGLKVELEKQEYDLTFMNNSVSKKMSYLENCRYRNFDGVVIVCADFSDPEVVELMDSDMPVVTVDYIHPNCTSVLSNNILGIEELVKYVYGKGHRRIAYIHGQKTYVTKDRLASFFKTADDLGLAIPDDYVREANYQEIKGVEEQTRQLLDLRQPPTCILYPDDTALIGGINVITERRMRIPEDISIAGYDGIRMSQLLQPKITTIRQNTDAIGGEAGKRLISAIEKPKTTLIERVVINGELLAGQSVGQIPENK